MHSPLVILLVSSIAFLHQPTDALKCFVNGPMNAYIQPNITMDCGNYMCSKGYSFNTQLTQRSCHPANVCSNGMNTGDYCQNVTDQNNMPMTYCCCTRDNCNTAPNTISISTGLGLATLLFYFVCK